jgi:uncharacterized protein (TIGR03067 family)
MCIRILIAAIATLGVTAFAPAPFPRPDRRDDLQKLVGTWTVTRYERAGAPVPAAPGNTLKVEIEGNKWSFLRVNAAGTMRLTAYSFLLDPKMDPRRIDLTMKAAGMRPVGGGKLLGIYRFEHKDRDKVQIVFHNFGVTERPVGFDGVDTKAYLMILQRDKR